MQRIIYLKIMSVSLSRQHRETNRPIAGKWGGGGGGGGGGALFVFWLKPGVYGVNWFIYPHYPHGGCWWPGVWPSSGYVPASWWLRPLHYNDVIMSAMASQITSFTIVYSTVYSGADQWKHESSASLAFVRWIHRWPVNSPHKWQVTQKIFPFDDVMMP